MAKGKSRDKSKEALWRRTVRQTPTITSFGLGRPLLKPPNGLFGMVNSNAGQESQARRTSDKRSLKSVQSQRGASRRKAASRPPPAPWRASEGRRQEGADRGPDLTAVVSAWPRLPDALRAGIVAMVKAADTGRP